MSKNYYLNEKVFQVIEWNGNIKNRSFSVKMKSASKKIYINDINKNSDNIGIRLVKNKRYHLLSSSNSSNPEKGKKIILIVIKKTNYFHYSTEEIRKSI
jgi:hypothetical protein